MQLDLDDVVRSQQVQRRRFRAITFSLPGYRWERGNKNVGHADAGDGLGTEIAVRLAQLSLNAPANQVRANKITDAQVGVYEVTGTTGNSVFGNRYYSTQATVQDPARLPKLGVVPSH